jgi:hypothetical protein
MRDGTPIWKDGASPRRRRTYRLRTIRVTVEEGVVALELDRRSIEAAEATED